MVRVLSLAVLAALVVAGSAAACSCVAESPGSQLNRADAAFVGKVQSIRVEGGRRVYTVAVERVYKGEVGATAEVRGDDPADGMSTSCDEWFEVGAELGGFFKGAPADWAIHSCNRASRERLDQAAVETGSEPSRPAPPAFVATGPFGDSPIATTDRRGRLLALAPADAAHRMPGAVSSCPGGTYVLDSSPGVVTIRRVDDLAAVGTLGSGTPPQELRCVRSDGQAAVGFSTDRLSRRGELTRLSPGRTRRLVGGPWAEADLGVRRSVLAAINPGGTLIVVDNATGRRRTVRRANRNCVDLALSPSEDKVAETVSRRGRERVTVAFVHDLRRRTSRRTRIDGYDLVWYARDRIAAVTYDNHARVHDSRLRPLGGRFLASDGGTFAGFGHLWWYRDGMLHRRGAGAPVPGLDERIRGPLIPLDRP